MAADLDDQAGRLAELSYGTDGLTAVFDLSYQQLPAGQARLFRLLSASPAPTSPPPPWQPLPGCPRPRPGGAWKRWPAPT